MTEQRSAPRQKTLLRGLVHFDNIPSAVDCLIRDISESGARLKFSSIPVVTDNVKLHIPAKGQTHQCKVQWSSADEIGVAFIAVGSVPSQKDCAISDRMDQLEAEIVALKKMVKRLLQTGGSESEVA